HPGNISRATSAARLRVRARAGRPHECDAGERRLDMPIAWLPSSPLKLEEQKWALTGRAEAEPGDEEITAGSPLGGWQRVHAAILTTHPGSQSNGRARHGLLRR